MGDKTPSSAQPVQAADATPAVVLNPAAQKRAKSLHDYRKALVQHKDFETKVRDGMMPFFFFFPPPLASASSCYACCLLLPAAACCCCLLLPAGLGELKILVGLIGHMDSNWSFFFSFFSLSFFFLSEVWDS